MWCFYCAWQTFTRFVEIGRVCVVNFGPDAGKLCTIIDLADGTKVIHKRSYGKLSAGCNVVNIVGIGRRPGL
jgi:hypothetical protein